MSRRRSGILTFEWVLVFAVLVIGLVGGLAVIRDSQIVESASTAEAIIHLNSSYHLTVPLTPQVDKEYTTIEIIGGRPVETTETYTLDWSYAAGSNFEDTFAAANDQSVQVHAGVVDTTADAKTDEAGFTALGAPAGD